MPFNLNLRKILIILGFAILCIGIGFGIYFTFFYAPAEKEPVVTAPTGGAPTGGLPSAGMAGPTTAAPGAAVTGGLPTAKTKSTSALVQSGAAGVTLSSDGSTMQYYDSSTGLFYKINADGSLTPLSNKRFYQVQNVTWSNSTTKAVLEYPDGSNIIYDFSTGNQTTLPKHWEDFEFSGDDNKIISKSIGDDVENRWLVVSDLTGSNTKIVNALGENADKVQVSWSPNNQVVAFSNTGDPTTTAGTQEIYLLGQNQENFKSLKVKGYNFKAQWAIEGDRIIYSVTDAYDNYKPSLWVTDASGDNVGTNSVKVGLNTWVDKCTIISGYKAYCAVPKSLDTGAGLQPSVADTSDDVIYFVDLKTGATSFVGEPDNDYSISKISVSSDESYLYFTDKENNGIHKMSIK